MKRSLPHTTLAGVLALLAGPVFAHVSGVDFGVPPSSVQGSPTITLPSGATQTAVTKDECEAQKQEGEECDDRFAFFLLTQDPFRAGAELQYALNYNGDRRTGTLTAGGDGNLVGRLSPGGPTRTSSGPSPFISGFGGYARYDTPEINFGTVIDFTNPANPAESALTHTNDNVSGWSGGVTGYVPIDKSGWGVSIGFTYSEADGQNGDTFQNGLGNDINLGWLYDQRAPNDSTGVSAASLDLNAASDLDLKYWNVRAMVTVPVGNWGNVGNSAFRFTPKFGIQYGRSRLSTVQSLSFITEGTLFEGSDLSSTRHQRLVDEYVGLGVGFAITSRPKDGGSGLGATFGASAFGNFVDHKLDSQQVNICDVCGPGEENFTVNSEAKDDSFGAEFNILGGISYTFSPGVEIGAYASAKYMEDMTSVANPVGEGDLGNGPQLGTEGGWQYQIGGYLGLQF